MIHLSSTENTVLFQRYLTGNYTRYPVTLVSREGREHLNLLLGWGWGLKTFRDEPPTAQSL